MVKMPISLQALIILTAISPRLAIKILVNIDLTILTPELRDITVCIVGAKWRRVINFRPYF